jgi:hypothetical protein
MHPRFEKTFSELLGGYTLGEGETMSKDLKKGLWCLYTELNSIYASITDDSAQNLNLSRLESCLEMLRDLIEQKAREDK